MWGRRPSSAATIDDAADHLFNIAIEHEEFVVSQGRDPNLITRAVTYLAHAHAIPLIREDTRCFSGMLNVLIELACPKGKPSQFDAFYRDVTQGVAISRADFD
jgi:hypothetical protein